MIYRSTQDLDFSLDDLADLPSPRHVLMTEPGHFEINYVINPHMEGHIGNVDREMALAQWNALRNSYRNCGISVHTVDGLEDLPDMVFCANQTLPYFRASNPESRGKKGVILSEMYADQRKPEVQRYADYFSELGFETLSLGDQDGPLFEGMGDAIWHPGKYLLWGGYGFRTDAAAYELISEMLDVRVLLIELLDPDFYHLDTCFSVLDDDSVLIFPDAFQPDGLALIRHMFRNVIESPEDEARELFSCNAHCPDGKYVLIQQGCTITNERLYNAGFSPVEVDTSEFLKAGGSVFCMKQMYW